MNNRSTYLDGKRNIRNLQHQSVERPTLQTHNSLTKSQMNEKSAANTDRMCAHIVEIIHRVNTLNEFKNISKESIKVSGSKIFFDVIFIFLKAMDGHFERADLSSNIDLIMDLFKMFGYTGNLSKNIFQPIGAPHTWTSCLAMLEWLGELANFYFRFQAAKQDKPFDDDINMLMLQSYIDKNQSLVKDYLIEQAESLDAVSAESRELALKNLHTAQKDIHILQKQTEKEKQMDFRTKQEVIQQQQVNDTRCEKIKELLFKMSQEKETQQSKAKTMNSLKHQINNQELTVEKVQAIKMEIKDLKSKTIAVKNKHQLDIADIQKEQSTISDRFYKRAELLKSSEALFDSFRDQLHHFSIQLNVPNYDIKAFMQFLKEKKSSADERECTDFLQTSYIDLYLERQDRFIECLKFQIGEEKKEIQAKDESIIRDERQKAEKESEKKEKQSLLMLFQNKKPGTNHSLKDTEESIQTMEEFSKQLYQARDNHGQNLKQLKKLVERVSQEKMVTQAFFLIYNKDYETRMNRIKAKISDHKMTILQQLRNHKQDFEIINQSFE